ncbi:MAG TPA: tetratricopeptide repeat protein [Phycisphaerales bacterium]|nr:tetratricopeptide repeat protein [Phycisphaerales bacterium]
MHEGESPASSRSAIRAGLGVTAILLVAAAVTMGVLWSRSPAKRAERLREQASALIADDPARAVTKATEATQLTPMDGEAWHTLGRAHFAMRDWEAAYNAFDTANVQGGYPRAQMRSHLAYAAWMVGAETSTAGDFARGISWMEKSLVEQPDDPRAVIAMASMYEHAQRWDESVATYERAIAMDPRQAFHGKHLARVAAMASAMARLRSDFAAAEDFLRRGEAADPGNALILGQHAAMALYRSEWKKAYQLFQQLESVDATQGRQVVEGKAYACWMLSVEAAEAGEHAEALRWMKESVALRPDDGRAVISLASCHAEMEQWPEAIEAYERGVKLEPSEAEGLRVYRAFAYWMGSVRASEAAEHEKALTRMERSVALDDTQGRAHLALAMCYGSVQKWVQAQRALERGAQLGADAGEVEATRVWLESVMPEDGGV